MAAPRGLGKGLGALIPTAADQSTTTVLAGYAEIPVGAITANPKQPRTEFDPDGHAELVQSIRSIGLLQPIVVRPARDGYELVAGERRLRATKDAGLSTIAAIIRQTDDDALLRDALLENLHRANLNALEEAAAYAQLLADFGCTQEELATRIGRSRPQVTNTLRLLKLPADVQRRVAAGVLSAGHARVLLSLRDDAAMERMAQRIVAEGLSVRAVEELVILGESDEPKARKPRQKPRAAEAHTELIADLTERVQEALDTRAVISLGKKARARITIECADVEDLRRVVDVISGQSRG
jgi:ParB family transcriptional regulator, chromosome partitioning protein